MTDFKQKLQYNSSKKQHEPSKLKRQKNIWFKKKTTGRQFITADVLIFVF